MALCTCDSGWDGDDCASSSAQLAEARALKGSMVTFMTSSLSRSDLSDISGINQQAKALQSIAVPEHLDEAATASVTSMVRTLVVASSTSTKPMDAATGELLLEVISGTSFATIRKVQRQKQMVKRALSAEGRDLKDSDVSYVALVSSRYRTRNHV